jgi:hypothetical protein
LTLSKQYPAEKYGRKMPGWVGVASYHGLDYNPYKLPAILCHTMESRTIKP